MVVFVIGFAVAVAVEDGNGDATKFDVGEVDKLMLILVNPPGKWKLDDNDLFEPSLKLAVVLFRLLLQLTVFEGGFYS